MKKIIIIGAHPDDETLGAGGTLLSHKLLGDKIYWINATEINEQVGYSSEQIKKREIQIKKVIKLYGFEKFYQLNFTTTQLNSLSLLKLISQISKIFKEIKPEIIYTLNRSDAHSDHRILFEAVYSCTKSFRHPYIKKILMYECLSETEFSAPFSEYIFIPNYFVDITKFLDEKIEIMKIFESEIGTHPFPRSEKNIRALASFRGATAGVESAEAFHALKIILK